MSLVNALYHSSRRIGSISEMFLQYPVSSLQHWVVYCTLKRIKEGGESDCWKNLRLCLHLGTSWFRSRPSESIPISLKPALTGIRLRKGECTLGLKRSLR